MSSPGVLRVDSPEQEEARRAVREVLGRAGVPIDNGRIEIRPSNYASTAKTFLVSCVTRSGGDLVLHCKEGNEANRSYGHRAGSAHEACLYEAVLPFTGLPAPRWYGSWREPSTKRLWLVMEHLAGALNVSEAGAVDRAAAWIGAFHRRTAGFRSSYLARYDRAYYQGWITRAAEFLQGERPAWVAELARNSGELADILLDAPASVIHGEYYPTNVLSDDRAVYPIDWESAAIAPGEVDLSALTDDWDEETIQAAERAYVMARWDGQSPSSFPRLLTAARLYWHSRWLGERPNWTNHASARRRWAGLRSGAEQLGILRAKDI